MPPAGVGLPDEDELVADLEAWRRAGVLRLRTLSLAALGRAAIAAGFADTSAAARHAAVYTELVRTALAPVAGSASARTALVLLGLDPDTFDLAPHVLREEAAGVYGLSIERFRREPQRRVLGIVAFKILELCNAHQARLGRLDLERRHPVDSRLAIKWLERFEAYFSLWTPMYALGADLTAYRSTLLDSERPWDRPPGTQGFDDPGYTQENQADGYGLMALHYYSAVQVAKQRWLTQFGGLWLLSSAQAEAEVRDALATVELVSPMNDRDNSWLRISLHSADGELHHFLNTLDRDPIGRSTRTEWLQWLTRCSCRWSPSDERSDMEYFPTGRYFAGINETCLLHRVVEGCNRFCTLIEWEWMQIADWYKKHS